MHKKQQPTTAKHFTSRQTGFRFVIHRARKQGHQLFTRLNFSCTEPENMVSSAAHKTRFVTHGSRKHRVISWSQGSIRHTWIQGTWCHQLVTRLNSSHMDPGNMVSSAAHKPQSVTHGTRKHGVSRSQASICHTWSQETWCHQLVTSLKLSHTEPGNMVSSAGHKPQIVTHGARKHGVISWSQASNCHTRSQETWCHQLVTSLKLSHTEPGNMVSSAGHKPQIVTHGARKHGVISWSQASNCHTRSQETWCHQLVTSLKLSHTEPGNTGSSAAY